MAVRLLDGDEHITVQDSDLPDVDGGDQETTYTVRQIPPEESRRIAHRHTKPTINRRTGTRESIVDHEAVVDDLLDAALVGWAGILHKGEPAPCTREFKLLLDFQRKSALLKVAGTNVSHEEAEEKERSFRVVT